MVFPPYFSPSSEKPVESSGVVVVVEEGLGERWALGVRQAAILWVADLSSGRDWRCLAVRVGEKRAQKVEARSRMGEER